MLDQQAKPMPRVKLFLVPFKRSPKSLAALVTAARMAHTHTGALADSGVEAGADALLGEVAPTIVEYANHEAVDLIVMGCHERPGPLRALLGSIADEVVRTAKQPVLLVRRDSASPSDTSPYVGVPTSAQAKRE
jgi:nucleotide-binding universal stress UspA family protein